jgi:hypothetical protein
MTAVTCGKMQNIIKLVKGQLYLYYNGIYFQLFHVIFKKKKVKLSP